MKHLFLSVLCAVLFCGRAQQCPWHCTCQSNLANCKSVPSLKEVLTAVPRTVQVILLQNGKPTTLEAGAFSNFSKLEYVEMNKFQTLALSNDVFSSATGGGSLLDKLEMTNSKLRSCDIAERAFSGLGNLTKLVLSNNALDMLKPSWFSDLVSLRKLDVDRNGIFYLPPWLFVGLQWLMNLNATSNRIRYISTGTFYGLSSLSILDLSKNELLFIDRDAFVPLRSLNDLRLSENKLATLAGVPESVLSLSLQNNLWECSCQLLMMLESWRKALENPGSLFCQSPESVRDKPILSLSLCQASVTPSPSPDINPALITLPSGGTPALSAVYGFIGGFFLAVAICLSFCCCRKHLKEGTCSSLTPHSGTTRPSRVSRHSAAQKELDASKVQTVSIIPPYLFNNELQSFSNRVQREKFFKLSKENPTGCVEERGERAVENREQIRLCKTAPGFLSANVTCVHNNLGSESEPNSDLKPGHDGSRGNTGAGIWKHCEGEQVVQSLNRPTHLKISQHNLEHGPFFNSHLNLHEKVILPSHPDNLSGNTIQFSISTDQTFTEIYNQTPNNSLGGEGPTGLNEVFKLYNEATRCQWGIQTANLKQVKVVGPLEDLDTEMLEGSAASCAMYEELSEMKENECPSINNPRNAIGLIDSSPAAEDTSALHERGLLELVSPDASKPGISGTRIQKSSKVPTNSMTQELQRSHRDENTQLCGAEGTGGLDPQVAICQLTLETGCEWVVKEGSVQDAHHSTPGRDKRFGRSRCEHQVKEFTKEGTTCSSPMLSTTLGCEFEKGRSQLTSEKVDILPTPETPVSPGTHQTGGRDQEEQMCPRALKLVNVKPAPNGSSVSSWETQAREIGSLKLTLMVSDEVTGDMELELEVESKPKGRVEEDIPPAPTNYTCIAPFTSGERPKELIPIENAHLMREDQLTPESLVSQSRQEEEDELSSLEIDGDAHVHCPNFGDAWAGNGGLSAGVVSLQGLSSLCVSRVAFPPSSCAQEASTLFSRGIYSERAREGRRALGQGGAGRCVEEDYNGLLYLTGEGRGAECRASELAGSLKNTGRGCAVDQWEVDNWTQFQACKLAAGEGNQCHQSTKEFHLNPVSTRDPPPPPSPCTQVVRPVGEKVPPESRSGDGTRARNLERDTAQSVSSTPSLPKPTPSLPKPTPSLPKPPPARHQPEGAAQARRVRGDRTGERTGLARGKPPPCHPQGEGFTHLIPGCSSKRWESVFLSLSGTPCGAALWEGGVSPLLRWVWRWEGAGGESRRSLAGARPTGPETAATRGGTPSHWPWRLKPGLDPQSRLPHPPQRTGALRGQ
ncbi:uncharacterized protein LOC103183064 [Callorhinchus milii]|uniref:uncharacterized protein LOC103183064 n=1 Tax=Callorhinchus milii TaxID=7868 RepID=UPI001C3FC72D|nr:uncharacterized protein LOC103183064 [Callorhinchus milii]